MNCTVWTVFKFCAAARTPPTLRRQVRRRPCRTRLPQSQLSLRPRLIATNVAEFFWPANKSSLPPFPLISGYRFVGDVLDFARCQLKSCSGGFFGWPPRHGQSAPPAKVASEKLFNQRRERAMIFSRRLFDGFFEIGINPKTDLRCLLAFLRHGLPYSLYSIEMSCRNKPLQRVRPA